MDSTELDTDINDALDPRVREKVRAMLGTPGATLVVVVADENPRGREPGYSQAELVRHDGDPITINEPGVLRRLHKLLRFEAPHRARQSFSLE